MFDQPLTSTSSDDRKTRFVADLTADERLTSIFLVKQKEVRLKKSGDPYLSLLLSDRTGELDAKMWDNLDDVQETFERDDFVKVRGVVVVFRNKPQLQIHKLRRVEESALELADFLPATKQDVAAMFAEARGYIEEFANPHLKALLNAIFDDPEIAARYRRAPAAKSLHHAFFGGLLEHVCSLCRLAKLVSQNYPNIDRDLLIAGILLHDLGKIYELSYVRSFAYTTEGQLLGHMVQVLEILHRKLAALPEFPRSLQVALEHLIISHHGKYEFGSPKLPMFPEALLLHQLDDMDSKMQAMIGLLERDRSIEGDWTSFSPSLERPLLKLEQWRQQAGPAGEAETASAAAMTPPDDPAAAAEPETLEGRAARLQAALRRERP